MMEYAPCMNQKGRILEESDYAPQTFQEKHLTMIREGDDFLFYMENLFT